MTTIYEHPVYHLSAPGKEHPIFDKGYVVDLRRSGVAKRDDGYLYFIADEDRTVAKIGRAKNPWSRLRDMQTGNPVKLEMVYCFRADMNAERLFHERYSHLRIRGEWFKYIYDFESFEDDDFEFRFAHHIGEKEPLNVNQIRFLIAKMTCGDDDAYLTALHEYLAAEKARGVTIEDDWVD